MYLATRGTNKMWRIPASHISSSKEILTRLTSRIFAQLRTNKSPFLQSCTHQVDAKSHPSPLFIVCNTNTRHTSSLQLHSHTHHVVPQDLETNPAGVTELLARWKETLAGGPQAGRSDSLHQQGLREGVDNNNSLSKISSHFYYTIFFYN